MSETIVAIVRDAETGDVYDGAYNWQTGQTYARSRDYFVTAIAPSGHLSIEEAQHLYDYERACFLDCFGA